MYEGVEERECSRDGLRSARFFVGFGVYAGLTFGMTGLLCRLGMMDDGIPEARVFSDGEEWNGNGVYEK